MKPALDNRRFLRDEELDLGLARILGAERRLIHAAEIAAGQAGLSRNDLFLLILVHCEPGLTVRKLRRRLSATVPTFARQIGLLDKAGWIDRLALGEDRRERQVFLSEEGISRLAPVIDTLRSIVRDAYKSAGVEAVDGARDVLGLIARM